MEVRSLKNSHNARFQIIIGHLRRTLLLKRFSTILNPWFHANRLAEKETFWSVLAQANNQALGNPYLSRGIETGCVRTRLCPRQARWRWNRLRGNSGQLSERQMQRISRFPWRLFLHWTELNRAELCDQPRYFCWCRLCADDVSPPYNRKKISQSCELSYAV